MYNQELKNRIYTYFINRLGMQEYRRGWLKGNCPFCGKDLKFGVNLSRNKANCFTCGDHGTPKEVIMEIEKLTSYEALKVFLKVYDGLEYFEKPIERKLQESIAELPEGYTNIRLGDTRLARMARQYMISRGFDIDDLSLKGFGYCREGKYQGYIIIPFFIKGRLVYFNARKFFGNGPKYNNPPIEDVGIGKSNVIYNIDALYMYETVYLAEGALNAETIGDMGIATGGKSVSFKQVSTIIKSPITGLVLLLDPDAIINSIDLGLSMVFHKKIKLVSWEGDQDVNDLGREETLRRANLCPWLGYNDLLKWKNEKRAISTYH